MVSVNGGDLHANAACNVQKFSFSSGILECMNELKAAGANPKWGAEGESLTRRNVFQASCSRLGLGRSLFSPHASPFRAS